MDAYTTESGNSDCSLSDDSMTKIVVEPKIVQHYLQCLHLQSGSNINTELILGEVCDDILTQ